MAKGFGRKKLGEGGWQHQKQSLVASHLLVSEQGPRGWRQRGGSPPPAAIRGGWAAVHSGSWSWAARWAVYSGSVRLGDAV